MTDFRRQISRRRVLRNGLGAALAAPLVVHGGRAALADQPVVLKISHQFPGGTEDQGDFRDRLCRKFAKAIEAKTGGAVKAEVYPNASLVKVFAQFDAARKGVVDMTLYPMPYAGGEVPELNIGLMPSLVSTYAQGKAWKSSEIGKALTGLLADKGIVMVTWVWQAGGLASRATPVVRPADAKGLKLRGGSREMDQVFKQAGATTLSTPSNEVYQAMQTGACDGVTTSATSLMSFRLEELSKALTAGRTGAYWFMCEPLYMSKLTFDKLTKDQQDAVMSIGQELEAFGETEAKADDTRVAEVFAKAGAKVFDMDTTVLGEWRDIAKATAWKEYAEKTPMSAKLIDLAQKV